ncbi:MAG: hypothetical protein R2911_40230 [Caldilineaceae bacterium]
MTPTIDHDLWKRGALAGAFGPITFADFPIDLGAEFIHGEGSVTHELVCGGLSHAGCAAQKEAANWGGRRLACG